MEVVTETTFNTTLASLRADEANFATRLEAFAEKAAAEIVAHERYRATLAAANSEIVRAKDSVLAPEVQRSPLPPPPPMRFDTVDKVAEDFHAKLLAAVTRLHKGAK